MVGLMNVRTERRPAFLLAKQRRHGGVDVDVDLGHCERANSSDAEVDHHATEIQDGILVEATHVAVDRIDARDDAAGQPRKERIGGKRFEGKHAPLTRDDGVEQPSKFDVRLLAGVVDERLLSGAMDLPHGWR